MSASLRRSGGRGRFARERLVEVAAVVEPRQRVEVGELTGLPNGVLDRRRGALDELREPEEVVGPEPSSGSRVYAPTRPLCRPVESGSTKAA